VTIKVYGFEIGLSKCNVGRSQCRYRFSVAYSVLLVKSLVSTDYKAFVEDRMHL